MARDLIPPPSPAGRPSPDPAPADPVAAASEATEPRTNSGGPVGPSPFRTRFGFMTGVLLGCAVAAALLAVTLVTTHDGPQDGFASNWSAWQPDSTDALEGASQIAKHIQSQYKGEDAKKDLVLVDSGPIAFGGLPLSVAVRPSGGSIETLDGLGIQYTLNGLGDGGVMKEGKPSKARNRLLRREALELALYSFRYLTDVSMVVALLPPARKDDARKHAKAAGKGKAKAKAKAKASPTPSASAAVAESDLQHQAIFYRPGDLRPQLEVPLNATLAPKAPPVKGFTSKGEEARRVDSLTMSNLFLVTYARAQDAHPYLVLDRPG